MGEFYLLQAQQQVGRNVTGLPCNIVVTGHREITEESSWLVYYEAQRVIALPETQWMFFGGARGADTSALWGALDAGFAAKCIIVVPFLLKDLVRDSRPLVDRAIAEGSHLVEMDQGDDNKRYPWPYLKRDERMVTLAREGHRGRCACLAFYCKDKGRSGGTYSTMQMANKAGFELMVCDVELIAKKPKKVGGLQP